eukprot:GFUD01012844.1.p1 GENE.GFUD01012844.1~~GFUD01012844.1.p1  ORF type:complete len:551 (-),score=232.75 GFUD01012844.1:91-1743(-)
MVGPKPVRPLSTQGALEKSSDLIKTKKTVAKKPANDAIESVKKDQPTVQVKESVLVKLQPSQIDDAVNAFAKLVELNSAEAAEKSLFSSDGQKVTLQISGIKLPRDTECQVLKIKLPHSPLPPSKDVCLFVKDLEKGLKVDHEDTVRHFTSLLADKGVTGVTQVISLRELKVEYKQYEAKTQLCHRFDQFLADDRIIRMLPQFLGKAFYKRKKLPVQVNLLAKDLPAEFAKVLNTTQLPLKNTGSCSTVVVGLTSLTTSQLVENTRAVVDKLVEKYPGGWVNIRSIHLNSGSTTLPLYVSFRSTAEVGLVRGGMKPNRSVVVDELSTVVGGTVVVTPRGFVKIKRKADPMWTEDDDTLKELLRDERGRQPKAGEEDEKEAAKDEDKENNVVTEGKDKKSKKDKAKKQKKNDEEDESEDEMEGQEMEYMKKVAEEEEEMEKQLEENEDKLGEKLNVNKDEESEEEDEVDDDAEAEDLLSEGDDSDSEEELIMKNVADEGEDDEEETAPKKKKKSLKGAPKSPKEKSANKKSKKQTKFVEKKKKEKVKGGKK